MEGLSDYDDSSDSDAPQLKRLKISASNICYCSAVLSSSSVELVSKLISEYSLTYKLKEDPHMTIKYWGRTGADANYQELLKKVNIKTTITITTLVEIPHLFVLVALVDTSLHIYDDRVPHVTFCCGPQTSPNDVSIVLRSISADDPTTGFLFRKKLKLVRHTLTKPLNVSAVVQMHTA